jgi:hypothetical protein
MTHLMIGQATPAMLAGAVAWLMVRVAAGKRMVSL